MLKTKRVSLIIIAFLLAILSLAACTTPIGTTEINPENPLIIGEADEPQPSPESSEPPDSTTSSETSEPPEPTTVTQPLPSPAYFATSDLQITPQEAFPGENISVAVLVTNSGGESGKYTASLEVYSRFYDSKTVHLAENSSQQIVFQIVGNDLGTHSVNIDNLNSQFTVIQPELESIPINLTLDYFGVENAHGGNVQLVVIAGDENESQMQEHLFPPIEEGYSNMGNFEVKQIGKRIFHTPSIDGNLKISVLAYHRDQSKTDYLKTIELMEWYYGDGIQMLKQLVLHMPENDELIGYYDNTWYPDENWGMGQYSAVGIEDLRLWFSIWSDTEPGPISEPYLLPDVIIQNLELPTQVRDSTGLWFYYWYDHILTIRNNESVDLSINWSAHSSYKGDFASGITTVPANSSKSLTWEYYYQGVGYNEITYTIDCYGHELDSCSGTVEVIPQLCKSNF